jgi:hypothetical protein
MGHWDRQFAALRALRVHRGGNLLFLPIFPLPLIRVHLCHSWLKIFSSPLFFAAKGQAICGTREDEDRFAGDEDEGNASAERELPNARQKSRL